MTVCLAGAAIGLGITLAAARLFGSVLYGISGADPLTYVAVPTVLLGVALLACYVPARHATKVPPVEALRADSSQLPAASFERNREPALVPFARPPDHRVQSPPIP